MGFLARRPIAHGVLYVVVGVIALAVVVAVQGARPHPLVEVVLALIGAFGAMLAVAGAVTAIRATGTRHAERN